MRACTHAKTPRACVLSGWQLHCCPGCGGTTAAPANLLFSGWWTTRVRATGKDCRPHPLPLSQRERGRQIRPLSQWEMGLLRRNPSWNRSTELPTAWSWSGHATSASTNRPRAITSFRPGRPPPPRRSPAGRRSSSRRWPIGCGPRESTSWSLSRAPAGDCPNFRSTKMGLSPYAPAFPTPSFPTTGSPPNTTAR